MARTKKARYRRCVRKVTAKDRRVKSPHAVCKKAVYGKKKK